MKKKATSFTFPPSAFEAMDSLIDKPPSILRDEIRGSPRSRNELIERLIEYAAALQRKQYQKAETKIAENSANSPG